jgi:hypothetical protein
MGREAKVEYQSGRERLAVRAHLDSGALQLTGGKKLTVALADVRKAVASDGLLKIETKTEKFALALGEKEAAGWAKKILNPPTLADKLGLKTGGAVLLVGEPVAEIEQAASNADRATTLTAAKAKAATVILQTLAAETAAKKIAASAKALPKGVALWLVYRKGTKPNGDDIIMLARKAGLKDTKVARISETHAALRFIK